MNYELFYRQEILHSTEVHDSIISIMLKMVTYVGIFTSLKLPSNLNRVSIGRFI